MNKIPRALEHVPVLTTVTVFFILGILIVNLINIPFFAVPEGTMDSSVPLGKSPGVIADGGFLVVQESIKHFPIPLPACRQAGETGRQTPTNSGELKVLAEGQFLVLWFICLSLLAGAFFFRRRSLIFFIIILSFSFSIGALHGRNYLRLADNHIASIYASGRKDTCLLGIVDSDPASSQRKTTFNFKVKGVILASKYQDAQGLILVNAFGDRKFSYGDELIIEGNLYKPFSYANRQNFSYREYLKNQGILYILNLKGDSDIVFCLPNKGSFVKSLSFRIRHRIKDIFQHRLSSLNKQVLAGIILGERQGFPEDIRQYFIRTGTAHIIAISGFNVGLITFVLLIFLKVLRFKRRIRYLIIIPFLVIHMYAVGPSASVVRATVMAIFMLIAYFLTQEPHIMNSLSLAALIILAYNPLQIFDVGFQLSFASVLAIVALSPKIMGLFKINSKSPYLLKVFAGGFSVSLSAWLATSGITAYYFRIFTPIAIIANLIIVPCISLGIILSFCLCLAESISHVLAAQIAASTDFTMALVFKITYYLSRLPLAYFYF